eukprot:gnl/MRDRNA2_/MRDRNA2_239771_c0_seq1.p1 gnl/MRDRNA2_/MRDRNA2_239771_c0~~gnl/MRDRNA2_/MRDRNA2_239771_c0_seq1.p1  ORF type:complete len:385 (+),score=77.61 gnl/MRDRNA2_/MRDRNA2_239771_c0_seq1:93-1157(+)
MIDIGSAFDLFLDEPSIDLHRRQKDRGMLEHLRRQYREPDAATVEKLAQLLPSNYPQGLGAAEAIQEWFAESHGTHGCLSRSKACEYDYFTELLKHAKDGRVVAQYYVGKIYEDGLGGYPSNMALAAIWLERAARRGHAMSALELSDVIRYINPKSCGSCSRSRFHHSLYWLIRAAVSGNAEAQISLGQMKTQGGRKPVVPRSDRNAVYWFRCAARQGAPGGLMNLGLMYHYGRGVVQDDRRAAQLFERSSAAGHAGGNYHLGLLYYMGSGKPKDVQKAARLFKQAVLNVSPGNELFAGLAAFYVGSMLAEGLLGQKNVPKAKKWMQKAEEYKGFLPDQIKEQMHRFRKYGHAH